MSNNTHITVLGAGSWGMTLANHCRHLGHWVTLWEFDPQAAERLAAERRRENLLPHLLLDDRIVITSDLEQSLQKAQIVLLVTPSHVTRAVLHAAARCRFSAKPVWVSCTKGLEQDTLMRISEIYQQEFASRDLNHFAVLSGPSHAEEVSRRIPTAVVIASLLDDYAAFLQKALSCEYLRCYRSNDLTGVELGGSLKNVIAIAAGICDGAGFGDNTKAALQPRGLAEITRLGRTLAADPLTFAGLSGMGDLIVTCMSRHSRNRFVGEEIGRGKKLDQVLGQMSMVAEGVRTCLSAVALAEKQNVEMPICREVYEVLYCDKDPKSALASLMRREYKSELWS